MFLRGGLDLGGALFVVVGVAGVAEVAQQPGGVGIGVVELQRGGAARLGCVAVQLRRPVDKEPHLRFIRVEIVAVELPVDVREELQHARMRAFKEGLIAGLGNVLRDSREPEGGVARDAIHVLLNRSGAEQTIEGVFQQEAVVEDVFDGAAHHVGVAHPAAAVTLGRVPHIVLHAEMRGVGS